MLLQWEMQVNQVEDIPIITCWWFVNLSEKHLPHVDKRMFLNSWAGSALMRHVTCMVNGDLA